MRKGKNTGMAPGMALALGSAILLGACSTAGSLSRDMAAMEGSPAGDATAAWGEPDATESFGDGTLMTWRDYAGEYGTTAMPVVICERQLAVDPDGSITGWRWRGDACESLHRVRVTDDSLQARRR